MSEDIFFRINHIISNDFRQSIKTLGFNNLCMVQKYQDFMHSVNHGEVGSLNA